MGLFWSERDRNFFDSLNVELLDDIIQTTIIIYKVKEENDQSQYGENIDKTYHPGVHLNVLIEHQDQEVEYSQEGFGPDVRQDIQIMFHRPSLKSRNLYPEIGDIVDWHGAFYQINGVIENQLLGGQYDHSIIANAHMTKENKITVDDHLDPNNT